MKNNLFLSFFSKEVQLAVSVGGKMVNWSMVVSKKLSLESLEIPWKLKVSTDNIATLNLHVLATTITALKLCPNPSSLISTVSILSIVKGSSSIIRVFGPSSGTKKVRFSAQCIGKQNRGVNLFRAPLVVEYTYFVLILLTCGTAKGARKILTVPMHCVNHCNNFTTHYYAYFVYIVIFFQKKNS